MKQSDVYGLMAAVWIAPHVSYWFSIALWLYCIVMACIKAVDE